MSIVPSAAKEVNAAIEKLYKDLSERGDGLESFVNKKIDLVVAVSGGCDSVSLLKAIAGYESPSKGRVICVYVNHHISPNADKWAAKCKARAKKLNVEFVEKDVFIRSKEQGLEAEARTLRYRALNEVAEVENCSAIVTAHHLDDQIETFLIQWMRGSGLSGLIGMPYIKEGKIPVVRPFLKIPRKRLETYARSQHMRWVEDDSNTDESYLRNFLRLNVIPELERARAGFKSAAGRSIEILGETSQILNDVDEKALQKCSDEEGNVRLDRWQKFSLPLQARVFRLWLQKKEFPPLPRTRLEEILRQIRESKKKAICLRSQGKKSIVVNGRTLLIREVTSDENPDYSVEFTWNGEKEMRFKGLAGTLRFVESPDGFEDCYLKEKPLLFTLAKKSRTRIKIKKLRPSKTLKALYQEMNIPEYERGKVPKIIRDGKLIYVAGIGEEIREKLYQGDGKKYSFEWVEDHLL